MRKLLISTDMNHEEIALKKLEIKDAADIYEYASNPNVKRYIGWALMSSMEETEKFIKTLLGKDEANTHAHASVIEKATGKVIGTIIIFGADNEANHCEIGYTLSEDYWNKGYGTAFVKHLCKCAFENLGYNKIFAKVCSENIGSQEILKKNNFKIEAVIKEYFCIEGVLQDCICLSKKR